MADDEDDASAPRDGAPPQPKLLDYFTAHAPDAAERPGLSTGWIILALGWLPFLCGLVNSVATVRSGMQQVIDAHHNAAILFSALGLLAMIVSLILFLRSRDGLGFLAALLSLVIASGLAACLVIPLF